MNREERRCECGTPFCRSFWKHCEDAPWGYRGSRSINYSRRKWWFLLRIVRKRLHALFSFRVRDNHKRISSTRVQCNNNNRASQQPFFWYCNHNWSNQIFEFDCSPYWRQTSWNDDQKSTHGSRNWFATEILSRHHHCSISLLAGQKDLNHFVLLMARTTATVTHANEQTVTMSIELGNEDTFVSID